MFLIALLGHTWLSREVCTLEQESDVTFATPLINGNQEMLRWSEIPQLSQSASGRSRCGSRLRWSWG